MEFFITAKEKSWGWFKERAHGHHAKAWLFVLSFSESSFFLIPPDVLLVAILLAGANRWVFYAGLTTVASVFGGMFGYAVGALFFDVVGARIVEFYGFTQEVAHLGVLFGENAFWVIFTAAFTPIPYKVFVLSAGFFKVNFFAFVMASVLGRGLRFFLVAFIVKQFGEHMLYLVMKYFNALTVAAVVLLVLVAALSWIT